MIIPANVQASLAVAEAISITVVVARVGNEDVFYFRGDGVATNGSLICIGTEPVILNFTVNRGHDILAVRFCPVPEAADGLWPVWAGISPGPSACPPGWDTGEFIFLGPGKNDRMVSLWNRNSNGTARYGYGLNFIVTRNDGIEYPAQCDPRIINRAN